MDIRVETVIENGVTLEKRTRVYDEIDSIESETYFLNGRRHRIDNPAQIDYYDNGNIKIQWYYKNGKFHNERGPAIIHYSRSGIIIGEHYYINDEEIKDEFKIMIMRGLHCDKNI